MLAKILPINDFILWLEGWLSTILQKRGRARESIAPPQWSEIGGPVDSALSRFPENTDSINT